MDELERWARLQGWFLTSHPHGREETWWQWLRIAHPEDGRHAAHALFDLVED